VLVLLGSEVSGEQGGWQGRLGPQQQLLGKLLSVVMDGAPCLDATPIIIMHLMVLWGLLVAEEQAGLV
jgi:hypothetical protein